MAVKKRNASSKAQKTGNRNTKTAAAAKSENSVKGDDSTTSTSSSSHQPTLFSSIVKVSFVAVAVVAIYVANNRNALFQPSPGYNDGEDTPKWENFNGIAIVTKAYKVLKKVDHDPTASTHGLQFREDQLIESTGGYGESLVRIWDPSTGTVSNERKTLPRNYYGAGLTYFQDEDENDRYIWLTYQQETAFVYDMDLKHISMFQYKTHTDEGWGITFDPVEKVFFVSDGSEYLQVWNLDFKEIRRVEVTYQTDPDAAKRIDVRKFNELEWDATDGTVLAAWQEDQILRIDPSSGQVLQIYDLADLYVDRPETATELNGIAHQEGNRWWLTGKMWSHLYLVEFLD